MKPRIPRTVPAVQAELDDWHSKVTQHRKTLWLLAWPQPSAGALDGDRVQASHGGFGHIAGIDTPARTLWHAVTALQERQHRFAPTELFPAAAIAAVTTAHDLRWQKLERLLLDMRPVADQASNLISQGGRPEWRPPYHDIPFDRHSLLAAKARRDRRGESETAIEHCGLTATTSRAGGVAVKRKGDRYRPITPNGAA